MRGYGEGGGGYLSVPAATHMKGMGECLGFGVWGLGFGVWGLGFGVSGLNASTHMTEEWGGGRGCEGV